MKMTAEHYRKMADYIDAMIEHVGIDKIKAHRALNLGKDKEKRFRWDLWWIAARQNGNEALRWHCDVLYKYLDDTHFDTALRRYVKEHAAL